MDVSKEIDAFRAKGLRHLNREEFEEAERVFKKLVKTDPSPTSRNNLAVCRFRQGDPEGALRVLKPNLEADLHILDRGGWAKLSALTRRFGSMEGDGFWWEEIPPRSTLGRLRRKALVFVGRAVVEGRRYKVAVIPVELREDLAELLGSPLPGARGEDSNGNDGGGADDAASGRRAPRGT
ncbi:MAG: tetratricopeptide repeat protein [Firmicutes bacterium]|nr:tetratricopeptide repeat protein [Bacillota bacterium]